MASDEDSKAGKKSWDDKLFIHGYLTQAYAESDDHLIFGIPVDGTFDYRKAALQFRYQVTRRDSLVVQLSHEAVGQSPVSEVKEDIELDWAFYQHQFETGTAVSVGRIQQPFGIYNEIRDVGVLLPFFRAPVSFYGEEFFASETVDGIMVSQPFFRQSEWQTTVDFFVGGWDVIEANSAHEARIDLAAGLQLWLETPVDNLRFGFGLRRSRITELSSRPPGDTDYWSEWNASFDWQFRNWTFQAEYRDIDFEDGGQVLGYVHVGVDLGGKFSLHGQLEDADFDFFGGPFRADIDLLRDLAVGFRFAATHQLVAKAEYHWNEGFVIEDNPPGFFPRFVGNVPFETEFVIISLSASF